MAELDLTKTASSHSAGPTKLMTNDGLLVLVGWGKHNFFLWLYTQTFFGCNQWGLAF